MSDDAPKLKNYGGLPPVREWVEPTIGPANLDDVKQSLAHALLHNGKAAFRQGHRMMAQITADHLVQHLERCGFVISKKHFPPDH
jgi:hypothetical protein